MNKEIFNTQFEYMLRTICILTEVEKSITLENILYIDFISSYGKSFGLFPANLHGENSFKFSEFPIRRERIQEALKRLVIDKYVLVKFQKSGIKYMISKKGQNLKQSLNDNYSINLCKIINQLKQYKESELKNIINKKLLGEGK